MLAWADFDLWKHFISNGKCFSLNERITSSLDDWIYIAAIVRTFILTPNRLLANFTKRHASCQSNDCSEKCGLIGKTVWSMDASSKDCSWILTFCLTHWKPVIKAYFSGCIKEIPSYWSTMIIYSMTSNQAGNIRPDYKQVLHRDTDSIFSAREAQHV